MTQYLTKQFIFLRLIALAAKRAAELCLNHTECRFNVAALVILTLEPFLIVSIEVIEPSPKRIFKVRLRVVSEINVRRSSFARNEFEIRTAGICLVSRYLIEHEVFSRSINQTAELWAIRAILISDNARRDDVGFHAAHNVRFQPVLLFEAFGSTVILETNRAPLFIKPTAIGIGSEAARVNGKIELNSPKRQRAFRDESVKVGREPFGLHVVRQRVEMRSASEIAALLRVSQILRQNGLMRQSRAVSFGVCMS